MKPFNLHDYTVRYGELVPCRTAFIDTHTPGSDKKENFTIIGGGVSESPDKHVHIKETPGFNIGAAGQPPHCRNSLHTHRTAEVFFVLKGRWKFFWGRWGNAGSVILEEGDIFNVPTGIFRGFQNIGEEYGMLMAVLGGDDSGGGVIWAPQVIEESAQYGLILGEDGRLYDSKKGESLPEGTGPMPLLTEEELKQYPEPTTRDVLPKYVARYLDLMALADREPVLVLGEHGLLRDRPGFEIEFFSTTSDCSGAGRPDRYEILMPVRGYWKLSTGGQTTILNPGDTAMIPPGHGHRIEPAVSGEASLYRVTSTDDPAGGDLDRLNAMPPLVLVPGLMCDAGLFSGILPTLSRERAVLVADIGQDDSMAAMADRLLVQLAGPFDLLGFSMGGFVALEVLKIAQERVRRLALLDTNAKADAPDIVAWRKTCIAQAKAGRLMDIMREALVPRYFDPDQPAPALAKSCLKTAEVIGAEVFCRQFHAIANRADHHATLRCFQGPALVLRGSLDSLCDRDAHLRMAEALPDGRYVEIDGAAHLSLLERPDAVASELRAFLKDG